MIFVTMLHDVKLIFQGQMLMSRAFSEQIEQDAQ